MHPRTFLEGYWRLDIKYQVFVAMPFGEPFDKHFSKIFKPAIEGVQVTVSEKENDKNIHKLSAYRVDNSKSGDSILTEIMDGIAHSLLILADLSEVGHWIKSPTEINGTPNGNVMYEVGLALAIRQQPEVILVRDKNNISKLLFDVSTIPCIPLDFEDSDNSIQQLRSLLIDRIKEIEWRKSNKIAMTLESLTPNEIQIIRENKNREFFAWKDMNIVNFLVDNALPGLLNKGIVKYKEFSIKLQVPVYTWTTFGRVIRNILPELPESPKPDSAS
jgi:hypothetical protein